MNFTIEALTRWNFFDLALEIVLHTFLCEAFLWILSGGAIALFLLLLLF